MSNEDQNTPRRIGRRTFVIAGGLAAVAAACSSSDDGAGGIPASNASTATTADATASAASTLTQTGASNVSLTVADFEALGTCTLLAEKAAGPFPLDEQFDRRDITEGYPGHPVRLGLRVVDASCAPVPGAVVEIWQADATGDYSAFDDGGDGKDEGAGTTFLRGSQTAGEDGIVEFLTLYPGWYPGRTVHIHVRIHLAGGTVVTSQLFFDDDYTAQVFTTGEYASNGQADTVNSTDGIAGDPAAEGTLLHIAATETSAGPGTLGLLNLAIEV